MRASGVPGGRGDPIGVLILAGKKINERAQVQNRPGALVRPSGKSSRKRAVCSCDAAAATTIFGSAVYRAHHAAVPRRPSPEISALRGRDRETRRRPVPCVRIRAPSGRQGAPPQLSAADGRGGAGQLRVRSGRTHPGRAARSSTTSQLFPTRFCLPWRRACGGGEIAAWKASRKSADCRCWFGVPLRASAWLVPC
jgi:hypothetical protein